MDETQTTLVLADIGSERSRQQAAKNWTLDHDDAHTVNDWIALLTRWQGRAMEAATGGDVAAYRQRLVQVGAITVAAIESLDRMTQRCPLCDHYSPGSEMHIACSAPIQRETSTV